MSDRPSQEDVVSVVGRAPADAFDPEPGSPSPQDESASRADRPLLPLLALFFLSGATGLVYEILWMRRITLVFGATQLAIATVLGAFMLGLALGAFAGGQVADRRQDGLRLYGILELLLGSAALAFPYVLEAAGVVYRSLVTTEHTSWWTGQVIHLVLMVLVLLVPTAAMGATLPLLVRFITTRVSTVGRASGLLYGFNTAGAVTGTWLCGFVLLPALGLRNTELVAAWSNIAIGVGAIAWSFAGSRSATAAPVRDDEAERAELRSLLDLEDDPDIARGRGRRLAPIIYAVLALSGACTMIYEVAWSRFLALVLGSSVYAFSLMLLAFLVGTAGGALVGSSLLANPAARPLRALGWALAGAGALALLTNHLFRFMPYIYVDMYAAIDGHDSLLFVMQALIAGIVMTPTTFCLGMTFPFAVAVVAGRPDAVGRDVSRVYSANTLGAVVGALGAGFALLPRLGIQSTLALAIIIDLLLAGLVFSLARTALRRRVQQGLAVAVAVVVVVAARPPWDPLLMSSGMYKYVSELSDYSHEAVRNFALSDFELLYYAEGSTSVVTVARSVGSGNIWLANNGKVDASTQSDLRTQVLLAHLPFAYMPQAQSLLVVGLASGITAGSTTLHPGAERIDVLEIEPAVVVASHYFDDFNYRPLEDPRVTCIANDARNHLELYKGTYDVIINEPSNPWITGVSNLFTREYLQLGRARLVPGGTFVQWVQTYGMAPEDLRSLVATFLDVFPYAALFADLNDSDLLLVGSYAHLNILRGDLWGLFQNEAVKADLARANLNHPFDLLSYMLMEEDELELFAGDAGLNTDDNVRIEFNAPLNLHYDTVSANVAILREASGGPCKAYQDRMPNNHQAAELLTGLAEAFERRSLWVEAADCYERAVAKTPEDEALLEAVDALRDRVRAFLEADDAE